MGKSGHIWEKSDNRRILQYFWHHHPDQDSAYKNSLIYQITQIWAQFRYKSSHSRCLFQGLAFAIAWSTWIRKFNHHNWKSLLYQLLSASFLLSCFSCLSLYYSSKASFLYSTSTIIPKSIHNFRVQGLLFHPTGTYISALWISGFPYVQPIKMPILAYCIIIGTKAGAPVICKN